jgi:hypothetical protein
MLFSFHDNSKTPEKLESGMFQCNTSFYEDLHHHLHCNLEVECEGGEDEGSHCPFSNTECGGMVASGGKCYRSNI